MRSGMIRMLWNYRLTKYYFGYLSIREKNEMAETLASFSKVSYLLNILKSMVKTQSGG